MTLWNILVLGFTCTFYCILAIKWLYIVSTDYDNCLLMFTCLCLIHWFLWFLENLQYIFLNGKCWVYPDFMTSLTWKCLFAFYRQVPNTLPEWSRIADTKEIHSVMFVTALLWLWIIKNRYSMHVTTSTIKLAICM